MTFRQCLTYSIFGHVALLALLFAWGPSRPKYALPPMAIPVRMVTLPQAKPSPKPAKPIPAPPKPIPPAPKPVPKAPTNKVVIPEKPKPAPKPVPKAKPAAPVPPQPAPKEQVDYEDFLAELRKEKGDEVPTPQEQAPVMGVANQAPVEGMADGSPDGLPLDPAALAWFRAVRLHLKRVWVVPPDFRTAPLEAAASAELDLSGNVLGGSVRIVHSSGNPYYDQSVERALTKASPLPPPPKAGEWIFVFRPEDF